MYFQNQEFLVSVFNELNNYVFILDDTWLKIIEVNSSVEKLLGKSAEEIRGSQISDFVMEEEKELTTKMISKMLSKDIIDGKSFFFVDSNDEMKVIVLKPKIYDRRLILIGEDVTENMVLRQNEMVDSYKFDALFNNPGVGNAIIDLDS